MIIHANYLQGPDNGVPNVPEVCTQPAFLNGAICMVLSGQAVVWSLLFMPGYGNPDGLKLDWIWAGSEHFKPGPAIIPTWHPRTQHSGSHIWQPTWDPDETH